MVWVPGGEFTMGSVDPLARPDEQPPHRVRVEGFWMDEAEVTNAQFAAFVAATGHRTVAERPVDWGELRKQVPPGTPKPPDSQLQPGALVFTPPSESVDLDRFDRWWSWTPGACWNHPAGPGSTIEGKEQEPVVHVAFQSAQGIACETTSCITILGPGTSPGALDQAMVIATTGLRRLRRGNPYAVLSLQGNPGTGHVCERTNLSGAPLLDDPTVALIPEFCSPAASRLLLERRGKYLSLVLGPTVPPLEQPMDLAYGLVNLSFESSRATADHCWTMTSYTVSRACKLHVREVLLHRATFGSAAPEAVFTVESVPPLRPEADGPDRTGRGAVDHGARFVSMGAGYSQRGRSEEDFVVPMGLKALELLGRDPADYERHRMVVEYPLPFVRGESWVRLPQ
jgi:hypothetical protein